MVGGGYYEMTKKFWNEGKKESMKLIELIYLYL